MAGLASSPKPRTTHTFLARGKDTSDKFAEIADLHPVPPFASLARPYPVVGPKHYSQRASTSNSRCGAAQKYKTRSRSKVQSVYLQPPPAFLYPHFLTLPFPFPTTSFEHSTPSSEFERPTRSSSSPQFPHRRPRSDSTSSSASLTATEENYARARYGASASVPHFPLPYPHAWAFPPNPINADDALTDSNEFSESESEHEMIVLPRSASSASLNSRMRSRRAIGRRDESIRTNARGMPLNSETETEFDNMPSRPSISQNIPDSSTLIPFGLDVIVPYLFEFLRFLSIIPSVCGALYNIYCGCLSMASMGLQTSSIDHFVCVIWAILTGFQCLALTTGLLLRWKAYYTTTSTVIRLLALQAICWPATHFTLTFFDHLKRPLACWILIGTTTCFSRSVQIWVTSNLYKREPSSDGRVLRDGRLGPRRWDWTKVAIKCILPAGVLYFITTWAIILKSELTGRC